MVDCRLKKNKKLVSCKRDSKGVPKNKAKRDAEFQKIIAKERKIEKARHKASLKSLDERMKLNWKEGIGR